MKMFCKTPFGHYLERDCDICNMPCTESVTIISRAQLGTVVICCAAFQNLHLHRDLSESALSNI